MASLLALLSQRTPNLQTRKGLILTGLQKDFLSPNGKLPVTSASGHVDHIRELVPAFREFGDVVWVRSQYEANRPADASNEGGDCIIAGSFGSPDDSEGLLSDASDAHSLSPHDPREETLSALDEELFLSRTAQREPCCVKGTSGIDFADEVTDLIDPKDLQIMKTYYSAFGSTSLLLTLRSKLITELFVAGNMTNLSVLATAMDASRYGIKITLVEDCLGYRTKSRHEDAIATLKRDMGAGVLTSTEVLDALRNPQASSGEEEESDEEDIEVGEDSSGRAAIYADSEEDEEGLLSFVRPLSGSEHCEPHRPLPASLKTHRSPQTNADGELLDRSAAERRHFTNARSQPQRNIDHAYPTKTEPDLCQDEDRIEYEFSGTNDLSDLKPGRMSDEGVILDTPWWRKKREEANKQRVRSSHPGLASIASLSGLDQATVDSYEAETKATQISSSNTQREVGPEKLPLFGTGREDESAGSSIQFELLPSELADTVFDQLNAEVNWQRMRHQTGEVPRLVSCQGSLGKDGAMPVYRHPSDQTLPVSSWSPTVDRIRKAAEAIVGHDLNHSLIQLYRDGTDFISEHSDKTLDIAKDSFIVNVSFGAQRTMRLRTKRDAATASVNTSPGGRTIYRVAMPHNSMIKMSLSTNAQYLHGINADKRPKVELTEPEKAYGEQRISLTFRKIATFLTTPSTHIWGRGATGKTRDEAHLVVNGDPAESERLIKAFGSENQASAIDWEPTYGSGFDVLHLK